MPPHDLPGKAPRPTNAHLTWLHVVEGLSYGQIARAYGLTRGVVASAIRQHRAKFGPQAVGENPAGEGPVSGPEEKLHDQVTGAARTIEARSRRITTLEDLLAAAEVDLAIWTVVDWVVNKWEVGAKGAEGQMVIEELFQVKARLARRKDTPAPPAVRPITVTITAPAAPPASPPPDREASGLQTALVLPDPQFGFRREGRTGQLVPFHDRAALDVCLQIARAAAVDHVVFLGDVLDLAMWTDKFVRAPEFYFTTQPALVEAAWYIGQLRAIAPGRVVVLEGNHDARLEGLIAKHLAEAYGLVPADQFSAGGAGALSIDNLLGLSRMGVEYIGGYPGNEVYLAGSWRAVHGAVARAAPGATARVVAESSPVTTLFGHIHRAELASRLVAERNGSRVVRAFCPGCLCHIDGRVPGSKRDDNWTQGAAMVTFDAEQAEIVPVSIERGQALLGGVRYVGAEYSEMLQASTGYNFIQA